MKKLLVITFLFFITVKGFSQCGVVSGFRFESMSGGGVGSEIFSDAQFTLGWTPFAYIWKRNGVDVGTGSSIDNDNGGFDELCLTVKATNSSTGDTCESKYCQIIYSSDPSDVSMYLDFFEMNSLTYDIRARICANRHYVGLFSIDPGDGSPGYNNIVAVHTYPDTGTYQVALTYYPSTGWPETITRKIYVGNGHTNFAVNTFVNGVNCLSPTTNFSSSPAFSGGQASSYGDFPNCVTCNINITNGNPFPMSFHSPGVQPINYSGYDSLNNIISACRLISVLDCKNPPDTISGTVWLDDDADGLWDATELVFSDSAKIKINGGNYFSYTDSLGNYTLPIPPSPTYIPIYNLPTNHIVTFPSSSGYNVQFNASTNHPGFNFGIINKGVNLCGKAYIDLNTNGVFDTGIDIVYSGVLVSAFNAVLNRSFSVSSGPTGDYCLSVPIGNYDLTTASNNLDSAFSIPDSIIINAPSAGNFYNNDFGFQTPVQGGNLGILLSSGGMPRPGFSYSLVNTVTNSGIDASSGTVVLNYSPTLIYVNSTSGGVHNATNKTVTWQTSVMAPTTSKYYVANFTVPVATPLGYTLVSNSTVTTGATYTDYNLANNYSAHSSTVIGSFDPNDKLVTPKGVGANGNVLHTQRLYYRVNFQNTGTASAINIIVQDSIDGNLDMTTFRMERASHNYTTVIMGNTITWKFFNINLPDSNTNEPLSHGFIEFSIKPKPGLPDGTIISNDADIYFDFNTPIVTNIVSNTLQTTLTGITENEMEAKLEVYPNPFKDEIEIKTVGTQERVKKIYVYDVYGREIFGLTDFELSDGLIVIPLPYFASGVYFVKIETGSGNAVKKLLRQN